MIGYTASWVVPISDRPIHHGWLVVHDGRIVARGLPGATPADIPIHDLGDVVVMPGLVNAHTHLELSHLRDAIRPADSFVAWVRQLIALRARTPDPRDPVILQGIDDAISEMRRSGTALVGDISNTLVTYDRLARSPLGGVVFDELLGFRVADAAAFVSAAWAQISALTPAERLRVTLAAHAPYSVAPALYPEIRHVVESAASSRYSVHLAESAEEVQFLRTGDGPWRHMLEQIGVWNPAWVAPECSPVEYLDRQRFLGPQAIAVHGVQMSPSDLRILAERGTMLVTCPRSNVHVGVGSPPIAAFYESGVGVAVGTDSLASTTDLNLFAELAEMRRLAPGIAAARILESATWQGAVALGFAADHGTIDPGKRAELVVVEAPAGAMTSSDVEEYLISGICPDQVRWIADLC